MIAASRKPRRASATVSEAEWAARGLALHLVGEVRGKGGDAARSVAYYLWLYSDERMAIRGRADKSDRIKYRALVFALGTGGFAESVHAAYEQHREEWAAKVRAEMEAET